MSAAAYNPNNYAGKHATTISFYALKTPDGKEIPIDGHIQGGVNSWRYVSVNPIRPNCCGDKAFKLEARDAFGNLTVVALNGAKGEIAGAWRGMPMDQQTQESFHRMLLSKGTGLLIPAGEPMFLQLNATTSIAVNAPLENQNQAKC